MNADLSKMPQLVRTYVFSNVQFKYRQIYYINKIQQDATNAGIYHCKLTLHVSGVYRLHHKEYIKL